MKKKAPKTARGAKILRELLIDNELQTESAPEWGDIRDVQRIFGIRETFCYELIRTNRVKTVVVRGRGASRGKRLINLDSVRRLLEEATTAEK